jgi:predicted ABC-type transport system involved in lysophospholipase L1 biosynthesis ATPase subunit
MFFTFRGARSDYDQQECEEDLIFQSFMIILNITNGENIQPGYEKSISIYLS